MKDKYLTEKAYGLKKPRWLAPPLTCIHKRECMYYSKIQGLHIPDNLVSSSHQVLSFT